jgi:hypothetical protein
MEVCGMLNCGFLIRGDWFEPDRCRLRMGLCTHCEYVDYQDPDARAEERGMRRENRDDMG